jgi:hypothetical protein
MTEFRDPTLEEIASVLDKARVRNGELRAACPVHNGDDPNLSITYKDGKLLATCHSKGCDFKDVVAAIRERLGEPAEERAAITRKDRAVGERNSKPVGKVESKSKVESRKTWELRDADDSLVAYHVREDRPGGKVVRWRMPDGTWKLDRETAELPLYGADKAASAPAECAVVVVEGEKAADALNAVLEAHGRPLVAVGTVTGASGTPSAESLGVLAGRSVVLWPDNDEAGYVHMGRVAEGLSGVAEVRWFEWDDAPDKGDAADHPDVLDVVSFVRSGLLSDLLHTERWTRPPAIEGRSLLGRAIRNGVEPPEELLRDVLLAGKAHNVYAPGGVGKTWVLVWIATELVRRGKRVVVFDLENGIRTYAERFEEMGADPEKLDELLHYYPFPMLDRERYERMLEEERPDLVMFDSWIGFLAAEGRDENVSNDISAWADAYSKPALRRGAAVLVLDHVPHEHERERGSTRKRDEVDVAWKLTKLGDFDREKTGTLAMTRMKDREGWLPEKLTFEIGGEPGAGFVMRRDDNLAPVEVTHTSRKERVALEVLVEHGDGMKAGQWRDAVAEAGEEIPQRTFYRMRDELLEQGKIAKEGQLHVALQTTTSSGVPTLPNLATAENDTPQKRGAPETVPTVPPPLGGVASQVGTVSYAASPAPDAATLPTKDGTTSGVSGFGRTKEERERKYHEMKRKLRERRERKEP